MPHSLAPRASDQGRGRIAPQGRRPADETLEEMKAMRGSSPVCPEYGHRRLRIHVGTNSLKAACASRRDATRRCALQRQEGMVIGDERPIHVGENP